MFCSFLWSEVFFALAGTGLDLDFVIAEKTLLVVCLNYIYADSNKSLTACVMLVLDPQRIRIENLKNSIGPGLKKIIIRTPLLCSIFFRKKQQQSMNFNVFPTKSTK